MGSDNSKPAPPPKTAKQLKKEMSRSINKMIREFSRDKNKLKMECTRMQRELEKMVKNGEPKASQKIIAQNILRNRQFVGKYDMMEAKMKGVKLQVAQVSTTEAMVGIMKGMGDILGKATAQVDMGNIQNVIQDFNYKMEQQEGINEMLDDAFDADEDEIEDDAVDDLLDNVTNKINGGKGGGGMKNTNQEETNTDDFSKMIDDLKK